MNIKLLPFIKTPYWKQVQTILYRNSKDVTQYFKIKHISLITHLKWLKSLKKQNPQTIAFFIVIDDTPVGVTYFHSIDYQKQHADWGIYIYPKDNRSKGIGDQALKQCILYAKEKLCLKQLFLDVLETNTPAIHVYEKNGFKQIGANNGFLRYQLDLS